MFTLLPLLCFLLLSYVTSFTSPQPTWCWLWRLSPNSFYSMVQYQSIILQWFLQWMLQWVSAVNATAATKAVLLKIRCCCCCATKAMLLLCCYNCCCSYTAVAMLCCCCCCAAVSMLPEVFEGVGLLGKSWWALCLSTAVAVLLFLPTLTADADADATNTNAAVLMLPEVFEGVGLLGKVGELSVEQLRLQYRHLGAVVVFKHAVH